MRAAFDGGPPEARFAERLTEKLPARWCRAIHGEDARFDTHYQCYE